VRAAFSELLLLHERLAAYFGEAVDVLPLGEILKKLSEFGQMCTLLRPPGHRCLPDRRNLCDETVRLPRDCRYDDCVRENARERERREKERQRAEAAQRKALEMVLRAEEVGHGLSGHHGVSWPSHVCAVCVFI
jgi:hypothetical protein